MVALRLDVRLRGRVDPSDVLQEAFLQAAQALPKYLERPEQPVFLWLRWLTGMTLQLYHRRHLGVKARDAGRDVQLLARPWPEVSSAALAAQLLGRDTCPIPRARRSAKPFRDSGRDLGRNSLEWRYRLDSNASWDHPRT
jgi:RNA polymerase sigma-70 factor (ECF subfamily)